MSEHAERETVPADLEVLVLGSSGSAPRPGNPSSGYLVRHRDTTLLVDIGFGIFSALIEHVSPLDLDGVLVSHGHADHCADLLALAHWLAYGPGGGASIPVTGPPGIMERFSGFTEGDDPNHGLRKALDYAEAGGDRRFGSITVRFAPANHSVPAVAMRLEAGGRSVTYTGDTGPSERIARLADGTDVLIAEATWQQDGDPHFPFHMTAGQAGEMAAAAGAGRLVLTHLRPGLEPSASIDEAAATYGRLPIVAQPGMRIGVVE